MLSYDIALIEKEFGYGMTRSEIMDLYDMLVGGEYESIYDAVEIVTNVWNKW